MRPPEPSRKADSLLQRLLGKIQRTSVMRSGIEHPQARSANLPYHILNRDEITERLVHLLPLDTQQASMNPIPRQRLPPSPTLSLRNHGLMMQKHTIRTTTTHIIRCPTLRPSN